MCQRGTEGVFGHEQDDREELRPTVQDAGRPRRDQERQDAQPGGERERDIAVAGMRLTRPAALLYS
jgi:hypothetical protein